MSADRRAPAAAAWSPAAFARPPAAARALAAAAPAPAAAARAPAASALAALAFAGLLTATALALPSPVAAQADSVPAPPATPAASQEDSIAGLAGAPTTGEGDRYRAQPDTLWYAISNPFELYWVRGADTLGWGGDNAIVEAHAWSQPHPDTLVGVIRQQSLDAARPISEDTFDVDVLGRVLAVRGRDLDASGRRDLLPPLPRTGGELAPGRTWSDTVAATWEEGGQEHLFAIERDLEVWDVADTADGRVVRVRSEGIVTFHTAFVVDSVAGVSATMRVRGPVEESFRVDVRSGRLLERSWSMRLEGPGAILVEGAPDDSLPAGMVSGYTMRLIDPERARSLARGLPGKDTTYATSYAETDIVLHTAGADSAGIRGGYAGRGGAVSTVTLSVEGPDAERLSWLRTAPGAPDRSVDLTRDGARVVDAAAGGPAPPAAPADVAAIGFWLRDHEELLVRLALSLPVDSVPHAIALWDVEGRRWIGGEALRFDLDGTALAVLTLDPPLPVLSLLVEPDGELLFVERGDLGERAPAVGTDRRERVDALIRAFTGRPREGPPDPGRRS